MDTPSDIVLRARLADYDYSALCRPLFRRLMPAFAPLAWLAAALFLLGILLPGWLDRAYGTGHRIWPGLLLAAGVALYVGLLFYRGRLSWRAMREAPLRQGISTIVLGDEGVDIRSTGTRTFIEWFVLVDVVEGRDGLLLLTGDMEALPVPAHAIPEGMTQDALKAHIAARIEAARPDASHAG